MNTVSTAEMANKIKFATMANFHEFCEEFCDEKKKYSFMFFRMAANLLLMT